MPNRSYLQKPNVQAKLTPEKPNARAITSVTTLSGSLSLLSEPINFISLTIVQLSL